MKTLERDVLEQVTGAGWGPFQGGIGLVAGSWTMGVGAVTGARAGFAKGADTGELLDVVPSTAGGLVRGAIRGFGEGWRMGVAQGRKADAILGTDFK